MNGARNGELPGTERWEQIEEVHSRDFRAAEFLEHFSYRSAHALRVVIQILLQNLLDLPIDVHVKHTHSTLRGQKLLQLLGLQRIRGKMPKQVEERSARNGIDVKMFREQLSQRKD